MSARQQYRILATLHAVAKEGHGFVMIPGGATVSIVAEPDDLRLVAVRWGNWDVFVFEQDLGRPASLCGDAVAAPSPMTLFGQRPV